MKFYFEGSFSQGENGKLSKVAIQPSSNSRTHREIFVLVAKELAEVKSGENYNFGLVGEKKTPMVFPADKKTDTRILVMGDIPQPKHRSDGYIDKEKTTAKVLDESQGGGAWGSGSCFLAILEVGQYVVSNRLIVWENVNGQLVKTRFISFEPIYERIDMNLDLLDLMKIHWAIIGGESGNETGKYRYRPCKIEWMEELVNDLTPTTSIFVKQMGTYLAKELKMSDRHGGNIDEFPEQLRIREFPKSC